MLVLFTDTDTDITPEIAKEYGYHLISMPYSIDGVNVYPYEDFDVFDAHTFYEQLRNGVLPNTSALNQEQYIKYFDPIFAAGDDILYVHFSRAMSASFEAMDRAVAQLLEKYPERRFYEIDTMGISILALNMLMTVGDMYKAGCTAEEMVAWGENEKFHHACYFCADDLKFFRHSGRVSGLAATMGTLLGIRPIITMNADGKMVSIGKEKGRAKTLDRLVSYMQELGDDVENHRIIVADADCPDLVAQLVEKIRAAFPGAKDIMVVKVNPTAGAHCGPNATGVTFHSVSR